MSKLFKSVGKLFKKAFKVFKKIAPFALAAAAVIFTGGAALGLLPTFSAAVGGVVSSLGLSAAVTGAITGAVTSAGFGAALGFVTGGTKGMQKGALMGALTGGVMGFASPGTFGIKTALDAAGNTVTTTANTLAHNGIAGGNAFGAAGKGAFNVVTDPLTGLSSGVSKGISPQLAGPLPIDVKVDPLKTPDLNGAIDKLPQIGVDSNAAVASATNMTPATGIGPTTAAVGGTGPVPQIASAQPFMQSTNAAANAAKAVETVANATAPSGGFLDKMLSGNGASTIGQILQAIASPSTSSEMKKQLKAELEMRQKMAQFAYGGVYSGNADAFGTAGRSFNMPQPRFYFDSSTNQVVDRQQPVGG